MWQTGWREEVWSGLGQSWDLIIVGGGITGAGLLQQATRLGLKTLLVEGRDFAWGTSSRSSKMVHGGLRYLSQGQIRLVVESVREREHLLRAAPGLVEPLGFLLPQYQGKRPRHLETSLALALYDRLAGRRSRRFYARPRFDLLAPHLRQEGLEGGFGFTDAQTDDARLVLRLLREAVRAGGVALNYAPATGLLFDAAGQVCGLQLQDRLSERRAEVRASVVINATGAWADTLRKQLPAQPDTEQGPKKEGRNQHLRPLRGSHLIFEYWRVPVAQAISFPHPQDGRMVMIAPWEGVTLVGTTDLDHTEGLEDEPRITPAEADYLLAAAQSLFPGLDLNLDEVVSTWAGVRPIVSSNSEETLNPSEEPRDYTLWQENGLLTVTGGKLTTFRLIARQALKKVISRFPGLKAIPNFPAFAPLNLTWPEGLPLTKELRYRLAGRYGPEAIALVEGAGAGELTPMPGTPYLWAELRWAARAEGVIHLDDLLLRRLRIGLLLHGGGQALLPQIRPICQPELGWDDSRWEAEEAAYLKLWHTHYSLPTRSPGGD